MDRAIWFPNANVVALRRQTYAFSQQESTLTLRAQGTSGAFENYAEAMRGLSRSQPPQPAPRIRPQRTLPGAFALRACDRFRFVANRFRFVAKRFAVKRFFAACAILFCLTPLAAAQPTVAISCSSLGVEAELCRAGAEAWSAKSGVKVSLVPTPPGADERLSLYLTLLASGSRDVDVLQIDTIWPSMLATHFVDLNTFIPVEERDDHLKVLIDNNTVGGKWIAAPFFVDAGLLYYRKDLLARHGRKPPETWSELAATAKDIVAAERSAGAGDLLGYVWQGRAYEGLFCNALEWVASNGGAIVDANGGISANSQAVVDAVLMARGWIGTISPRSVLNYSEEETRSAFQSGKAVFMRNWPYAWALANADDSPVRGKVGVAPLPAGSGPNGRRAATLGGQQLAVSRYSAHPKEAADLVRYLTGPEEQKRRALAGSFNPTRRSLYQDRELLTANPFYAEFLTILEHAVARPSTIAGRRYNKVAHTIVSAIHDTLSGAGAAEAKLEELQDALRRISRDGAWN